MFSNPVPKARPVHAGRAFFNAALAGWTPAEGGVDGVIINETADFDGTGTDQVVVKIPKAGTKQFARLRVDIAP